MEAMQEELSILSELKSWLRDIAQKNPSIQDIKFLVAENQSLTIRRIGEGVVINFVFRVQNADGSKSIIVKYGQEKAATVDEFYPIERQDLEYNSLSVLHLLLPGTVPQPYCFDKELHMILMDDLEDTTLLGSNLKQGDMDTETAGRVGSLLATIHRATHKQLIPHSTWTQYLESLKNDEIRDKVMYYRFTCLRQQTGLKVPQNCSVFFQESLEAIISRNIIDDIQNMYYREDCFMHADPHMYSFLCSNDKVVLIDFEFGSMGNHTFSLAFIAAFYILCKMEAEKRGVSNAKQLRDLTRAALETMIQSFRAEFREHSEVLGPWSEFISEAAAFAGFTIFSYPMVDGVEILVDLNDKQKLDALKIGTDLMTSYKSITDTDKFLNSILP